MSCVLQAPWDAQPSKQHVVSPSPLPPTPAPPQALEKLSHDHPGSLLRNGALVAVLSYVDFFQTGVQRVAVATAANMCRGLSAGDGTHADAATAAAPILIGLLQYQVGGHCWACAAGKVEAGHV